MRAKFALQDESDAKNVLIDTHTHLDAEAFRQDLNEVLERAAENGISKLLTIGIDLPTSQAAVAIAEQHPNVFAVVGIQPNYAQQAGTTDWDQICQLAQHDRVVGIGETGLDKYWDFCPLDLQQDYFRRHLQFSRQSGLPFVVHCREAEADVLEMLEDEFQQGPLNGVMHSFCGDAAMAERCIEMGMYISFAGMVTFKKNNELREVARSVPLTRMLVETDAPYLAPQPNRGKRNEPAWVRHTAQCLADVHQVTLEDLAQQTSRNATQLFRL